MPKVSDKKTTNLHIDPLANAGKRIDPLAVAEKKIRENDLRHTTDQLLIGQLLNLLLGGICNELEVLPIFTRIEEYANFNHIESYVAEFWSGRSTRNVIQIPYYIVITRQGYNEPGVSVHTSLLFVLPHIDGTKRVYSVGGGYAGSSFGIYSVDHLSITVCQNAFSPDFYKIIDIGIINTQIITNLKKFLPENPEMHNSGKAKEGYILIPNLFCFYSSTFSTSKTVAGPKSCSSFAEYVINNGSSSPTFTCASFGGFGIIHSEYCKRLKPPLNVHGIMAQISQLNNVPFDDPQVGYLKSLLSSSGVLPNSAMTTGGSKRKSRKNKSKSKNKSYKRKMVYTF